MLAHKHVLGSGVDRSRVLHLEQKKREPEGSRSYSVPPMSQRGNAGGLTPATSSITRTTWQL